MIYGINKKWVLTPEIFFQFQEPLSSIWNRCILGKKNFPLY